MVTLENVDACKELAFQLLIILMFVFRKMWVCYEMQKRFKVLGCVYHIDKTSIPLYGVKVAIPSIWYCIW